MRRFAFLLHINLKFPFLFSQTDAIKGAYTAWYIFRKSYVLELSKVGGSCANIHPYSYRSESGALYTNTVKNEERPFNFYLCYNHNVQLASFLNRKERVHIMKSVQNSRNFKKWNMNSLKTSNCARIEDISTVGTATLILNSFTCSNQ